jgi:glycosyltransferase involved in cell wall biosynthesis
MIDPKFHRICLVPRLSGVGGMVSFQAKLSEGLSARGIETCYDLDDAPYDAVLVIGGTHHLDKLRSVRKRGVRVVQRLDGMNWLHRAGKKHFLPRTGLRHFLRAEYGNLILRIIRSRLADFIIYQSEFSRSWWEREYGKTMVDNDVVYNGVNLNTYTPEGEEHPPTNQIRILMVEGSLMGGYESGIEVAYHLAQDLTQSYIERSKEKKGIELMIVGRVDSSTKHKWEAIFSQSSSLSNLRISWVGLVPAEKIPAIDRSAHFLYSSDINAACPNAVIEALACGTPVLAFDTGALPELVPSLAGRVVPYGGNPWLLDPPDIGALVQGAKDILDNHLHFTKGARQHAVAAFDLDHMVEQYLEHLYAS